jgi:glucose-fructose oxidoreductase
MLKGRNLGAREVLCVGATVSLVIPLGICTMNADNANPTTARRRRGKKIRYAVVGLGHIAQMAVLPAFAHAKKNSVLAALVSDDAVKRRELGESYSVPTYSPEEFDSCLASGGIDALYIALPNHLHCEYSTRAAEAGMHVLCEKPMAVTEEECRKMIHAAEVSNVKLMVAYRLHFEETNLRAVEAVQNGDLGMLRFFEAEFAIDVQQPNIRLERELGGGSLYDVGIYCINAARYIFQSEPEEVVAFSASSPEPRFEEVDEMSAALLRFPNQRLATVVSSFGAKEVSSFRIVGTKGNLRVEPAFDYASKMVHYLSVGGKTTKRSFSRRDQFAPELIYFSDCILQDRHPEPDGEEGLRDVRIIEALYRSATTGRPVRLPVDPKAVRPSIDQEIHEYPVSEPEPVHVQAPQRD